MKTNEKITIPTELKIENENQEFGEIELKGEGYLKIIVNKDNPNFNTITIDRLINNKVNPLSNLYDICITTEDGKDAPSKSGLNGGNAKDGGPFTIYVKDLVNNIKVHVEGGRGGKGGSGEIINPKLGGNGGNGGNGGKAPDVSFYYGHEGKSSGIPYQYSKIESLGGIGGNGGNGAICPEPMGTGETSSTPFTTGGKNGDGGKAGNNGKKGSLVFHDTTQAIKPLNLNNEDEYKFFLDIFGGEDTLKKYPKIWSSIQKNHKKNSVNNSESNLKFITTGSSATLVHITSNKKNSKATDSAYVKFQINSVMNVVNMDQSDQKGSEKTSLPTDCSRVIDIIEDVNGVENIIKRFTLGFYKGNCNQISETFDTPEMTASSIANKYLKIRTSYMFTTKEGIIPASFTQNIKNATVNIDTFYRKISLKEPHYHHDGKTSGNIRILYGRTPSQNLSEYTDSDYYGNNEFGNFENNRDPLDGALHSIPTTILPIKGTIHFNNCTEGKIYGYEILDYVIWNENKKIMTFPKPMLSLSDDSRNMIVEMGVNEINPDNPSDDLAKHLYNADSFKLNVNPENDNFTTLDFDLHLRKDVDYTQYGKCDWISKINSSFYDDDNIHANTCNLLGSLRINVLYYKDGIADDDHKGSEEIDVSFQSISEDKLSNHQYYETEDFYPTVYLPILIICWGCYAADTLIKTTKGCKKACEIKRGDKIPVYSGKILTVSQIYIGDDKWICNIKTIDNKSIRVSGSHAMKLYCESNPDGKKISAGRIKKGDILMTPNGNVKVDSVETEAYNDKVYNFEFEEEKTPNYIEANGFWSGDFNAQNEVEKRELTSEQKEILEEMKQLAAELSQKDQQ